MTNFFTPLTIYLLAFIVFAFVSTFVVTYDWSKKGKSKKK